MVVTKEDLIELIERIEDPDDLASAYAAVRALLLRDDSRLLPSEAHDHSAGGL